MTDVKRWLVSVLVLLVLPACSEPSTHVQRSNPEMQSTTSSSAAINEGSFLTNFADLALVDSDAKPFSAQALVGHTTLVNFIFTHCDSICPTQTKALTGVYDALPIAVQEQVRFVSVSIDPQNDDPAQLKAFAKQMGADKANWSFVTGKVNDIEQLVARLHIFDDGNTDPALRPQIHRTSLWLIDSHGRMLQRYKGDPPDQARLIKELTQVNQMALTQAK